MSKPGTAWNGRSELPLAVAVSLIAVAADQISKWLILEWVMSPPRLIEITPFFNLTLGFNRGVSFGLLGNGAVGPWLLSGLAVAVVIGLLLWARRTTSRAEATALGAIIGGALGNVIDRVRQGAVTDFLDFHALGWHWPTFNVADVAIFCGTALLVVRSMVHGREPVELPLNARLPGGADPSA